MIEARFTATLTSPDDDAYVTISSFDGGQSRTGPVTWQPRITSGGGAQYPAKGDRAYLEESEAGRWVVAGWQPTATSVVADGPLNVREERFGGPNPVTGDWSAAFNAARDAGTDAQTAILIPAHADPYLIAEPIPHDRTLIGTGSSSLDAIGTGSVIKAHPALADHPTPMLLDGAANGYKLALRDLVLDGDLLAGVQLIGSTLNGGRHGTFLSRYENVTFRQTAPDVYALGVATNTDPAGSPAPGMFVGSVFDGCFWDNCAAIINLSSNQDDVLFDAPRFHLAGTNQATVGPPMRLLTCSDIRLVNPYVKLAEIAYDLGPRAFMWAGGYPVTIKGGLWEVYDADPTNVTHLIWCLGTDARLSWTDAIVAMRDTNSPDIVALVRTQSVDYDDFPIWPRAEVRNVQRYGFAGYGAIDVPIFEHYQLAGAVAQRPFSFSFSGVDDWPSIVQWAASSDDTPGDAVVLHGTHRGRRYDEVRDNANQYLTDGARPSQPDAVTRYQWHGGIPPVSTASPSAVTYQLPAPGLYRLAVVALINGDPEHMLCGEWQVAWRDGSINNIADSEQIGTTKTVIGSGFGPTTLTVTDPTSSGVLTVTAAWTTGSAPVRFGIRAERLTAFYPDT